MRLSTRTIQELHREINSRTIAGFGFSPSVKIGTFTRDTTIASGTQAIPGIGFKPKVVLFFAVDNATLEVSAMGFDDGSNKGNLFFSVGTLNWQRTGNNSITDSEGIGTNYVGNISTMDVDGFTISWTRNGAPTGTINIDYCALR